MDLLGLATRPVREAEKNALHCWCDDAATTTAAPQDAAPLRASELLIDRIVLYLKY